MTHEQFEQTAQYWNKKEKITMPEEALKQAVEKYIQENNTCALATGSGDYVRCTPIEYSYHDGKFWMFSEGGEKFIGLEKNANVSLAIFDKYDGFGNLESLQIMGRAEIITVFRQLQCPRGIQEDSTGGTEKIRASHEPDLRDTGQDRCAVF